MEALKKLAMGRRTLAEFREAMAGFAEIEHYDPLGDGFGFAILWQNGLGPAYAVFAAYTVETIGDDIEIDGDDPHVLGNIRFDGCASLDFDHEVGSHWCGGLRFVESHCALMRHLFEVAEQRMKAAEAQNGR